MRRPLAVVHLFAAALIGGAVLAGCATPTDTPTISPATNQFDTSTAPVTSAPAAATQIAPATTAEQAPAPQAPVQQAPVQQAPVVQPPVVQAPPANDDADCGGDYYINSDGDCVHRPEQAPSAPTGATAKCNDGSYSFSKHRSGTCSSHGGVADWL
ncbi:MAG TPA: DUF3761 domain-containing protein [Pseudonocardiaceae bacterium]|jgi:hypothetical protein|nr:DUF3761 domain-containing protein [Pseudonocardiaceae bacterium]